MLYMCPLIKDKLVTDEAKRPVEQERARELLIQHRDDLFTTSNSPSHHLLLVCAHEHICQNDRSFEGYPHRVPVSPTYKALSDPLGNIHPDRAISSARVLPDHSSACARSVLTCLLRLECVRFCANSFATKVDRFAG